MILNARLGVHKPALVTKCAIAAHEDIVRNRLSEDFDFEHIGDDLLGLAVNVRVHERNVVVTGDDVAESRETFVYTLDGDWIWK